jgi:S-adenosylmethionine hydrolase
MIVTLLTDFGTADGYVGEMKGVISELAPGADLIDITHDISAQDIEGGRLALARYWQRFPVGTVHVAVVDPGVGGTRAALATTSRCRAPPDVGRRPRPPALLMPDARAVMLPIPPGASATFHGRDVFAPAAARLVLGTPVDDLGTPATSPVVRRTPEPRKGADGGLHGIVMRSTASATPSRTSLGCAAGRSRSATAGCRLSGRTSTCRPAP